LRTGTPQIDNKKSFQQSKTNTSATSINIKKS